MSVRSDNPSTSSTEQLSATDEARRAEARLRRDARVVRLPVNERHGCVCMSQRWYIPSSSSSEGFAGMPQSGETSERGSKACSYTKIHT